MEKPLFNTAPRYQGTPPAIVCTASNSAWSTCILIEDITLEGGEDSDDDDNICAYKTVLRSIDHSSEGGRHYSVFTFSQSIPGGVKFDLKVLSSNEALYIYLTPNLITSYSKECLMGLLDYADSQLNVHTVYCMLLRSPNQKHIIKQFQFFGFDLCPPGVPVTGCSNYLFLKYDIHCNDYTSSDSDSEN